MADLEQMALFSVQPVEGKGNGVVATAKITKGTRILAESPFITLPRVNGDSVEVLNEDVLKQLRNASRDQQRAFFSLTNIHGKTLPIPLGIIQTNALAYGPKGEGGLFITGSQFNHACVPTACIKWNCELDQMTVHTLCDIEPGEEITITYVNLGSNNRRRDQLDSGFQFICSSNGIERAHVPATYDFAAKLAVEHKDYARAKIFCQRQLDIAMTEGGPDHPDTQDQLDMKAYLESILQQHSGPIVPYHFSRIELEDWLWMQHMPEDSEGESSEDDEWDLAGGLSDDSSSNPDREVWSDDEDCNMGFGIRSLD
ncbi:SET domain protein [Apiospora marii]|uniref:SET domain protein n=1 Tax=Apiospora marii TaxID=335849 RepID=UPI00312CC599